MNVRDLRNLYLEFFEAANHLRVPSGSLVPYDVTGRLDESLLFNGAGMVQFKPYFRGLATPPAKRLTNVQKCLRTGDIDDVGDLSHLTFFEMLGNFAFDDYFKREAIGYSWDFLTGSSWLGLDPIRLAFTVFEDDDESFELWSDRVRSAGLAPESRVFRLGEQTNFWPAGSLSNGPPGPCGPNTEMFYWTSAEPAPAPGSIYSLDDYLQDEAAGKWLEVWNDVFITYDWQGQLRDPNRPQDGYERTGLPNLPFPGVDTGMGLERTATALAGKSSIYDTDLFEPLLDKLQSLADFRYGSNPSQDRAARIVLDHARAACLCISDGILPSNTGRGYVLRRLIRRAVVTGTRRLDLEKPFFDELFAPVLETLGETYPELSERADTVRVTLRSEEELFRSNLREHLGRLEHELAAADAVLSGESAFRLYETYGFPVEVTQELAAEKGLEVDLEAFASAMSRAQERSRASSVMDQVYAGVEGADLELAPGLDSLPATEFVGYETLETSAKLLGRRQDAQDHWILAFDRSPFYAESGGQVSDSGWVALGDETHEVETVSSHAGVRLHRVANLASPPDWDTSAILRVDGAARAATARHHTATHLLHAALREVLGAHVAQAGSLVSPEVLRFDFTHGQPVLPDQLERIERIVNEQVLEASPVRTWVDLPLAEARRMGAMALFGEKYGDRVRLVQIGDMKGEQPSFSRELCGGTHVANTGQIGLVLIVKEFGAAAGVRRIEAVAGMRAHEFAREQMSRVAKAAASLKVEPARLLEGIERLSESLREERRKRSAAEARSLESSTRAESIVEVGPVQLFLLEAKDLDPKAVASSLDAAVAKSPSRVAIAALVTGEKLLFQCKVGPAALAAGAHAGKLVNEVAKIAGGGGGGRPEFATAGARDVSKAAAALEHAKSALKEMLDSA